ncbi:hypothetical protein GCM10009765_09380 [Fodinicola feengrottensis]|uniref:Uncharacterized protein n=1 Tax=Fodinicola feengrottensis TaxID=435914 RepID=A0ABN2FYD0_9ACTN
MHVQRLTVTDNILFVTSETPEDRPLSPSSRFVQRHAHQPGNALGAICRPYETLEMARCQHCGQMLVKPEEQETQWRTVSDYVSARIPSSTASLL